MKIKRFSFLNRLLGNNKKPEIKSEKNADINFNMKIEDIFYVTGKGTVVCGKINSGNLDLYDLVRIKETGEDYVVTSIDKFHKLLDSASEGDNVGISLQNLKKGDVKRDMTVISPDEE